jgi:exonuclease VII small subunit
MLSKIRLVLAFALLILGMITLHAKDNAKEETAKYMIYLDIRAELDAGDLTLEEAQRKWQKAIKNLKKEEGK